MAFPLPLVVPKTRIVTLGGSGGESARRATLTADIRAQSLADVHAMLVGITREDTAQQIRIGNPPQLVEVDNKTNVSVENAKRKTVVVFGTTLAKAAMRMVETELQAAISASTRVKTGRLRNMGSWEWRYIPKGSSARIVSSANPPAAFARGDKLVLVPASVPYATAVNRAVANSGRLNAHTATGRKRKDGSTALPPKASQNLGFLAATARAVRRRSEFKQFAVIVEFTRAHAVAGEVYKHGTGVITIRPRFRQVKV